jgi:hypothetical protein
MFKHFCLLDRSRANLS